eukprot:s2423_g16.t1
MEIHDSGSEIGSPAAATASSLAPVHGDRASGPSTTVGPVQTGGRALASSSLSGNGDGGWELALSAMESSREETAEVPEGTNSDAAPPETPDPPSGSAEGTGEHLGLQEPQAPAGGSGMDSTSGPQIGRDLASFDDIVSQHVLADGEDNIETTRFEYVPTGTSASPDDRVGQTTEGQGPLQRSQQGQEPEPEQMTLVSRHSFRRDIATLVLENRGDMICYANASFLSFLWAVTSRQQFCLSDLGTKSAMLQELRTAHRNFPLSLAQQPWFIAMLLTWPEGEGEGQADAAEFTGLLTTWLDSPCYSCRWERRLWRAERVCVEDSGSVCLPLVIQLDPALDLDGVIPLRALIRNWAAEHGMCQALVHAQDVLCIHLDRFCHDAQGRVTCNRTPVGYHWGIEIPEFEGDGLSIRWVDYGVVAAVAHTGTESQGHYECLLRTDIDPRAYENPTMWLHADDNRPVTTTWLEPDGFTSNVVQLWLCRTDAMELHAYHLDAIEAEVRSRATAMLQILAQTPPG